MTAAGVSRPVVWSSLLAAFLAPGCSDSPGETERSADTVPDPVVRAHNTPQVRPTPSGDGAMFTDITDDVGLAFEYHAWEPGSYNLPGIMGGGCAVFDADGDGDLDVYLVNGHDNTGDNQLSNRLFLQGTDGRFTDATDSSNLGDRGYGMGCAVADIDNDGDIDVYITNFGHDRLFCNDGDGTFTDVTEEAGISNPRWSTSAAFIDYDRDGWLDLYVANYLEYDQEKVCGDEVGRRDFCGPGVFPTVTDRLYHNQGGVRFVDVTETSGVAVAAYAGLGVVCADFDDDGWIDIYVANDRDPNLLWMNQRDGTFVDDAIILGAAFNSDGSPEGSMGVAAGDADEDGDLDIFVTHFEGETNTYYRNENGLFFDDATSTAGLGIMSLPYIGWGTAFFDADLDGDLDLAVANGAVSRRSIVLRDDAGFWNPYVEPNMLLLNDGRGRFDEATDRTGRFGAELEVTRALIPIDIDEDGDQDMLITNIAGPARLYRNEADSASWVAITVRDPALNREALGAKVIIRTDTRTFVRHAIPPGGYVTSGPASIHIGLQSDESVQTIDVRWPDGAEEHFTPKTVGRIELLRGAGGPGP